MPWHFEYNRLAERANTPPPPIPPQACLHCQGELPPMNKLFCSRACMDAHKVRLRTQRRKVRRGITAEQRRGLETVTHGDLSRW